MSVAVAEAHVLTQLSDVSARRGLSGLADKLTELQALVSDDLSDLSEALSELPRGTSLVHRSANHLLDLGGKRLRPLCVLLAARMGEPRGTSARDLAVAVELVHSATLLHDDVVDVGDHRRGLPPARVVYGNAASIFAGDWLLIEAIRRVRRARVPGTLDHLLGVIEEMIFAEALQLAGRGRINTDRAAYFRVIEGKTAALFRWALFAGGRAGGLPDEQCRALEDYGLHLGVAFQAVDDLLDLTGDTRATGKELFADLREGKMTFPLIVALEREPGLLHLLEQLLAEAPAGAANGASNGSTHGATHGTSPIATLDGLRQRVVSAMVRTGSQQECLALARGRVQQAIACLETLPRGPARAALVTVAEAAVDRDH